ncbi:heme exporter protein CcmD [Luteimonas abyssi]|uniref:heme exporter protein CcmD n=1 Tax=Luteimonas abyssi TaxID=1247514 RepID=UPI000737BE81|nr:heme exporter protein CcmD [Luteimonas abyssi]
MSYLQYVVAAYLVFVAVLLWDFVAPRIRIRRLLRGVRLLAARRAGKPHATGELTR